MKRNDFAGNKKMPERKSIEIDNEPMVEGEGQILTAIGDEETMRMAVESIQRQNDRYEQYAPTLRQLQQMLEQRRIEQERQTQIENTPTVRSFAMLAIDKLRSKIPFYRGANQ